MPTAHGEAGAARNNSGQASTARVRGGAECCPGYPGLEAEAWWCHVRKGPGRGEFHCQGLWRWHSVV